jgi:hypothetical protein
MSSGGELWTLRCGSTNAAIAGPDKLYDLTKSLDALITEQQMKGEAFIDRAKKLGKKLEVLRDEVRLGLASTRLRKGCDLVPFF